MLLRIECQFGCTVTDDEPRRVWTDRSSGIPVQTLQDSLVKPVMAHVAARHIKRQFGLAIIAICGRAQTFPYHEHYSKHCTTPTFQAFSALVTNWGLQPAYDGEVTKTQTVLPSEEPLEQCVLPVYPTFTAENKIPQKVLDAWTAECKRRGVNPDLFLRTGGHVQLTRPFLQACAYFATDESLWGQRNKPLKYVPMHLRDEKDLPTRIVNSAKRGRGRPRKDHIAVDLGAVESLL